MRHINRNRLFTTTAAAFALTAFAAPASAQECAVSVADYNVDMTITCDNHYAVYVGTSTHAVLGVASGTAWTSAENLSFSTGYIPTGNHFLYIVAWSDDSSQQGLLAEIDVNGHSLRTGDRDWMVYATGDDRDFDNQTPTLTELQTQLDLANVAAGIAGSSANASSIGWVLPTIGGTNQGNFPPASPWSQVAGINECTEWIWYDSGLQGGSAAPFDPGFNHKEYLIFRVQLPQAVADPCPADVNGDGVIDVSDMLAVLAAWGMCP